MSEAMVRTQVYLPRDVVDVLERQSEAQGVTVSHQIRKVLVAHITRISQAIDEDDLILRADDPLFSMAGRMSSGIGDLSVHHDSYLYRKDWLEQSGEGTNT